MVCLCNERMGLDPWLPVQNSIEAQLVVIFATRSDQRLNSGTTKCRSPWTSLQPAHAARPFGKYRGGDTSPEGGEN